jgi:uncharacterized protein
MTDREMCLVRRFKSLVEQRLVVHRMMVFGSRARGDGDPDSDLDVLVIIEQPATRENRRFISECAFEVDVDNDFVISPLAFSRTCWESSAERFSPVAQAIEQEGVPV